MTADDYPIFCPRQVRAATREEPAEMCMNEVDEDGDLCPEHDEDDRADELYDAYLEAKYEREHNPDYYTDFGG